MTDETRTRDLLSSHNPPTPVAQGCELLQKPLIDADFLALGCPVFPRAALSEVSEGADSRPGPLSSSRFSFFAICKVFLSVAVSGFEPEPETP